MKNPFRYNSKPYLFIELAKPNEYGFSKKIKVSEFIGDYKILQFGNGGDWPRSDGSLAKHFIVDRIKVKGKIVAVQLCGKNTKKQISKSINSNIIKKIQKMRCAVLNVGNVEVDHKDGHRDDYEGFKSKNQNIEQFQPLSKAVNSAKKEHCKKCRNNKIRFDAVKLGYSVSVWAGGIKYMGTCVGCYWYDIKKFNEEISKDFLPNI